jgi:hypothetical protein
MKYSAILFIAILSFALGARAAVDNEPRDANLSPDIDTWYQGHIVEIDRDNRILVVHGSVMPHATQHAKMMREIADQTANLPPERRAQVEAQIRAKWQHRFEKAKPEERVIGNRSFNVQPQAALLDEGKTRDLTYLDEDREVVTKRKVTIREDGEKREEVTTYVEHRPREERIPLESLRDLHLEDNVMIGYASDPKNPDRTREALAVIRENDGYYTTDRVERVEEKGEVEKAGRTMERHLEDGANKIKHFFD